MKPTFENIQSVKVYRMFYEKFHPSRAGSLSEEKLVIANSIPEAIEILTLVTVRHEESIDITSVAKLGLAEHIFSGINQGEQ